ncbi:hypothetical protein BEJ65_25505 [Escherichia coli]|nr:hypothetical protein BEJ65_25505 [Escherichia coli]
MSRAVRDGSTGVWKLMNYPRLLSCMDNPFSQTCQQPAFMFFYLRIFMKGDHSITSIEIG